MTDDKSPSEQRPTLRDDSRARARDRILQGASIAVARSGLDVTIDEVADEAGVSRRTVFRHFANHGDLIAASIRETTATVVTNLPRPPAVGEDPQRWLTEAIVSMHELIRRVVGRAFWDIYVDRGERPDEVVSALSTILDQRRRYATTLASGAWIAGGGVGSPPTWVVDAFSLHASGFATFFMPEGTARETGELSARILWLVVLSALRDADVRAVDLTV